MLAARVALHACHSSYASRLPLVLRFVLTVRLDVYHSSYSMLTIRIDARL